MATFYDELNDTLREFIARQQMFFHATAATAGRINLSPKGLDTFRVLDNRHVGYLDLTGSECETAAHIAADGRLTIMFCSYAEKPLILRLYGRGTVIHQRDAAWNTLRPMFPAISGERQIILLEIDSIMTTCGFAVPMYDFKGHRDTLPEFTCKMGDEKMDAFRREKNVTSIDGLPTYLFEDAPTQPISK